MYYKGKWCTAGGKDPLFGLVDGFQIDPKILIGVQYNLVTLGICPAPLPIRFIRVYREFVNFQRTAESACILQNAGGLCWGCAAYPNPSAVRNRGHMILYRVDPLTITLDVVT